jgi:hypothetical protein
MIVAPPVAFSRDHFGAVHSRCAQVEMWRFTARRVVTVVQHVQPIGWLRTVGQSPRQPVRGPHAATPTNTPVTLPVARMRPLTALTGRYQLTKEVCRCPCGHPCRRPELAGATSRACSCAAGLYPPPLRCELRSTNLTCPYLGASDGAATLPGACLCVMARGRDQESAGTPLAHNRYRHEWQHTA